MAKSKKSTAAVEDVREGFVPAASFDAGIERADEVDPRDAEIAALKARVAELENAPAGLYKPGRYRVSIPDGPTAIVEPAAGEHPFDVFKRVTGMISTIHAPEIAAAGSDEPLGVVR